jgi:hypothetical protein
MKIHRTDLANGLAGSPQAKNRHQDDKPYSLVTLF